MLFVELAKGIARRSCARNLIVFSLKNSNDRFPNCEVIFDHQQTMAPSHSVGLPQQVGCQEIVTLEMQRITDCEVHNFSRCGKTYLPRSKTVCSCSWQSEWASTARSPREYTPGLHLLKPWSRFQCFF